MFKKITDISGSTTNLNFLRPFPCFAKQKKAYDVIMLPLPTNFQMPEPIFIKLGMYIMAHEPISTA
jgi:hypothetical protein